MKKSISLLTLLGVGAYVFMNHPKFGRKPKGGRLARIKRSPLYRRGKFLNLSPTPSFTNGANYFTVLKKFLLEKSERTEPKEPLPSLKTELLNLDPRQDVLVWFGHSSYFLQADGKRYLIDPVLSGSASPFPGSQKSFKGSDQYVAADIPDIDYLIITHDHWDHLDYQTLVELKSKIKMVITGLGTGEHLEKWGYDPDIIHELEWEESLTAEKHIFIQAKPARHFSGRGFKRNTVLWTSFVLKTKSLTIYIGGDSGYDSHFKKIGEECGPFDLAILENGQYNIHWEYIHMMPHQTVQAAIDLKAARLFPVHNSKFNLALHAWDDPLRKITSLPTDPNLRIITPRIGEKVDLQDQEQNFSNWWEGCE